LWLLFYISITADVKHLARALEKVNYRPVFTFSSLSYTFLFLSVGYALAGVWKFATGNVEDGYFWLFGGLAIGAVVLGVFLWRRLRSAAAA
jgi:membrane protein DedA with SNARE-associated domain